MEAPCGRTHFGLPLDLTSPALRGAREPFVSPLRAVAAAAADYSSGVVAAGGGGFDDDDGYATTSHRHLLGACGVVPFYCARAYADPGRELYGARCYGSTGMEGIAPYSE